MVSELGLRKLNEVKMNEIGKGEHPQGEAHTACQNLDSRKGVNHWREGCSGVSDK